MMSFLLVLIFISSMLSLMSYVHCWRDVKSGRAHVISLRQISSVMDRTVFNGWFGAPQPGYFYVLTPEQVKWFLRRYAWPVYGECAADAACLFGAWWFASGWGKEEVLLVFVLLAGLCQAMSLGYYFWLMRQWRDQIHEEIDHSDH